MFIKYGLHLFVWKHLLLLCKNLQVVSGHPTTSYQKWLHTKEKIFFSLYSIYDYQGQFLAHFYSLNILLVPTMKSLSYNRLLTHKKISNYNFKCWYLWFFGNCCVPLFKRKKLAGKKNIYILFSDVHYETTTHEQKKANNLFHLNNLWLWKRDLILLISNYIIWK